MYQPHTVVPEVSLFLLRGDNQLFLLRRCNTGYEDGAYCLPAGHKDANETARQAMAREAKEETGIEIDPNTLRFVQVMHRMHHDERIGFYFVADVWEGEPANVEPAKCDHAEWFSLDALPEKIMPFHRHAIEEFRKGSTYSEFGW